MVEIGGRPMLWHIMRYYSHFGFNEFAVALGYKGDDIRRYFFDYRANTANMRIDLAAGTSEIHGPQGSEKWLVDLIETGRETNTGGRIKRLAPHLGNETFFLTWGDGVSNIDLLDLLQFHQSHGRLVTVTAVHPPPRFGQLILEGSKVIEFSEKPLDNSWINGAFFVVEPAAIDYIDGDETHWELDPMDRLAKDGQLMAYQHHGFWQCMDTIRDKVLLQRLWETNAPWKVWSE